MKALVTGGAGFIGSHLTQLLLENGHQVVVLDNLRSGRLTNFDDFKGNPNLKFVQADIRKMEEIGPHFDGVDWVFHLAAMADIVPSIENPREYFEVNVDGTFNVLECSKDAKVKRFLYTASSSCYGIPDAYPTPETAPIRPQYPYALTKFLGEELVMHWEQVYKLPALSLRLFNVYGPRARTTGTYGAVFGVFLTQKLNNKPLTVVGDGTQTRDFTFVKDVARAFLMGADSSITGEIFNVGSGDHYSVNRIIELLNHDSVNIPKRPGEPEATFADVSKIQQALGFKAETSFENGVAKLLEKIDDFRDAPLWEEESIKEATKTWFEYLS
ncbi:MAG: SDR family oxidoreductase [Simkaniaceae bacterium]|nr:MAG: SDR family oxidoreductase [Simkaniaceae bacterium]